MPIGGVVVSCIAENKQLVLEELAQMSAVEVHGADDKGNIVAVLDTETSEQMEQLIDRINTNLNVLTVGMTYLNTEDEAERMANGEKLAKPFGFKKALSIDT